MKRNLSLEDYTTLIMELIYFKADAESTWAFCDLKLFQDLIDIMRWYRQFLKTIKRGDTKKVFSPKRDYR